MKKILITNNLLPLIEMGRDVLSRDDIKIFSVPSGEDLVSTHRMENIDLIITELDLPGMNGDEACAAIKNDNTLKKVPVVIVSYNEKSAVTRCQASDADSYMIKPISTIELLQNIKKHLHVSERRGVRVTLQTLVSGNLPSSKLFSGYSRDISTSGILVETDELINKGAKVKCLFTIEKYFINIIGIVVREGEKSLRKYSYGIQFMEVNKETKRTIERFIENSIKHIS